MRPHLRLRTVTALRIFVLASCVGLLLAAPLRLAFGQSRSKPFSQACNKIRVEAVRDYWKSTVSAEQAQRMARIVGSDAGERSGAALVAEALAGRVTVQQLGASSLAGFDAVEDSAVCGELDRQNAMRLRLLLPQLMIQLADQIANQRKLNQ